MDCSPPGSSVHGMAVSASEDLLDQGLKLTSLSPALAGEFFTTSTAWEVQLYL